jgi:hypothetical protein
MQPREILPCNELSKTTQALTTLFNRIYYKSSLKCKPRSWLITGLTRATRRVSLVEQELFILPVHLRSPLVLSLARVTRSIPKLHKTPWLISIFGVIPGAVRLWCVMPLATTLQLYRDGLFSWWRKLDHIMLCQVHLAWVGFELTRLVVIGTDCIGCCKSSYHTIKTTTGNRVK